MEQQGSHISRRDLTWSRHQLEELAERRFLAAQDSAKVPEKNVPTMDELGVQLDSLSPIARTSFQDLFKKVAHADFSSYLAKLQVSLPLKTPQAFKLWTRLIEAKTLPCTFSALQCFKNFTVRDCLFMVYGKQVYMDQVWFCFVCDLLNALCLTAREFASWRERFPQILVQSLHPLLRIRWRLDGSKLSFQCRHLEKLW